MQKLFENDDTEPALPIVATNAFNCMNRLVGLYSIQVTCAIASNYLINTYRSPSKLFVAGGNTTLLRELIKHYEHYYQLTRSRSRCKTSLLGVWCSDSWQKEIIV